MTDREWSERCEECSQTWTVASISDDATGEWGDLDEDEHDTADEALDAGEAHARAEAPNGDYGQDEHGGARVRLTITVQSSTGAEQSRTIEIDIEPDHDAAIKAAGGDPDCDHDWSGEGEGGCDQNPGVWSTGGTSFRTVSHCTGCGVRRIEHVTGSQSNPGDVDTTTYEMPDEDERG